MSAAFLPLCPTPAPPRVPDQRHDVPRRSGTQGRLVLAVFCPAAQKITPPAAKKITPPVAEFSLGPGSAPRSAQLVRDTREWARMREVLR